jgi:hypothetical protein
MPDRKTVRVEYVEPEPFEPQTIKVVRRVEQPQEDWPPPPWWPIL